MALIGGDDGGAPKPGYRRLALILALTAVWSDYVGVSMMRVSLPFFAKAMGGTSTMVGGLETVYGIGQAFGALALPRLSDVWGRRRILLFCCICSGVGYSMAVASRAFASPGLLLASRFPVGMAKQTVTVSRAIVADTTPSSQDRSRWMSFSCAALAFGCMAGPLLGSCLLLCFGELAPAMFNALLFMLLVPVMALLLPETCPTLGAAYPMRCTSKYDESQFEESSAVGSEAPLWRSKSVIVVLAVLALPELGLVSHQGAALVAFCMQNLGKSQEWIAGLTSLSAIVQAISAATVFTWLTKHGWSDTSILQLGSALFCICAMAIFVFQSSEAVMLSAPLAAAANAVLRSYPATFLSKQVGKERQGEALGLLDICSSGLRVLAPLLAGLLLDNFGARSVFAGEALLFIMGILGVGVLPHHLTVEDVHQAAAAKKAA